MLELEGRRLGQAVGDHLRNKGLIFPVVFRGQDCLPEEIRSQRTYENFDHITVKADFEKRDCQKRLKGLSEQIFIRYKALHNAGIFKDDDCGSFRFPDLATIQPWLESVSPICVSPMPGR